eukprot:1482235-Pyramimonas_sp.AAC.1
MAFMVASKHDFDNGLMGVGEFKELEQGMGFHPNEQGILADHELSQALEIAEIYRSDWVHDFLQRGVFARECTAFVR